MRYDATRAPAPGLWLQSDEQERLSAVVEYHRQTQARVGGDIDLHAAVHVAVENQLAEGLAATVDTFERLIDEGLGRHEAVHAIGAVVAEFILCGPRDEQRADDELRRRLALLDAASWRARAGSAGRVPRATRDQREPRRA